MSFEFGLACGGFQLVSLTNAPSLPYGAAALNGQTINDGASSFNGVVWPNLNGFGGGTKRFLRGSTTSGTTGGADTYTPAGTIGTPSATVNVQGTVNTTAASNSHTHIFTGTAASYLPSFYEIVWWARYK